MTSPLPTLGIIAGSGRLPAQLIEACRADNRPCFVLAFEENTNVDAIENMPHAIVRLGAIGTALKALRQAGVKELVLAGRVARPTIASLRPDLTATKLLARLGAAFFAGDDALLKAMIKFLESEGFKVISAQEILRSLIATEGVYGKISPTSNDKTDIIKGLDVAKKLGELDIGQAAIIENSYVLGVEGPEGTNALIARCAKLKRESRGGVLIKAKKPNQDERADLPAIGPDTLEAINDAGFNGIAVEAGGSIVLDKELLIRRADALGLFVIGVRHEQ